MQALDALEDQFDRRLHPFRTEHFHNLPVDLIDRERSIPDVDSNFVFSFLSSSFNSSLEIIPLFLQFLAVIPFFSNNLSKNILMVVVFPTFPPPQSATIFIIILLFPLSGIYTYC